MALVRFSGEQGRILWQRIGARVPLLREWVNQRGLPEPKHVLDFVNFFMDASWEDDQVSVGAGRRFADRRERIEHRGTRNRDIYRLSVGKHRLDVQVEFEGVRENFSLGRVRGFTAVIPLNAEGARRYLKRDKYYGALDADDIVPRSTADYHAEWVLLNSAVHFPSIRRLEPYRTEDVEDNPAFEDGSPSLTGYGVLVDLFTHVGRFITPLKVESEQPPRVVAVAADRVPTCILAPVTGLGVGKPELQAAGFSDIGGDKFGNTVFAFDPSQINNENTRSLLRERMLQTVKTAIELSSQRPLP